VPRFLADLSIGQRQVLAALTALVLLLGLAAGAVALGDDDPGPQALRTEDGDGSSTSSGATSSSAPSSSTSTSTDPGDGDEGKAEGDEEAGAGKAGPSTTVRRGSATTARSTATTRKGAPTPSPSSTATSTTQPSGGTGCTTGGTGGTAGDLAARYCKHRGSNGASARMERNGQLDAAAASWAAELGRRGELAHGDYTSAVKAVCPTCTGGENVAVQHPPDTGAAWDRWLGSPPHRANLDNAKGGVYGTGVAQVGDRMYYVHIFGWR
jgi:uncharacterized protein YkwD